MVEGLPFYGPIQVSLTTEGDTSPDSALAVDRMPIADADGNLSYARTFEVSDDVAERLGSLHIVQHGIDIDDSGAYDGRPSELNPAVPFEATVPANCGSIDIAGAGDLDIERLAGRDRFGTAVEVSRYAFPDGAPELYLARADMAPDALVGGILTEGPILLIPSCDEVPEIVLEEARRLDPDRVVPLGGEDAICEDVVEQVAAAAVG